MMWFGIAVAVVVVLAVGAYLLRRAHPPMAPEPEIPEADRIRRVTPAAPMVSLESALDGATDAQGRTLRDQLSSDAADLERLRVDNDTSPILRRALDQVASPGDAAPDVASTGEVDHTSSDSNGD